MRPEGRRARSPRLSAMIPASPRGGETPVTRAARRPSRSEAVHLEEQPDRLRDLLEAVLAEQEPVVRMRGERLVPGIEPFGQPLRVVHRDGAVETGADDQLR